MSNDPALAKPAVMTLRLPNSVRDQAKLFAARDGVSLNAWIASAVAEKNAAMAMLDQLGETSGLDRDGLLRALEEIGRNNLDIPGNVPR